jgi:hypothetical protein
MDGRTQLNKQIMQHRIATVKFKPSTTASSTQYSNNQGEGLLYAASFSGRGLLTSDPLAYKSEISSAETRSSTIDPLYRGVFM